VVARSPIYHGPEPVTYRDCVIGVERLEDVVDDIRFLHKEHWDETETLYLPGRMDPDYERMIMMEREYRFVLFVVRGPTGDIVGNLAYHMNYSLHQRGLLIASEDAFFITKAYRNGRLAIKLLEYAERILAGVGVHCLTIGDKSPAGGASLEKLVTRRGYQPVVKGYVKMLED